MERPATRSAATIVVADDDETVREVLGMAPTDAGYTAVPLPASTDVHARIATSRPDALVLDLWERQPDRGLALLERLQADPAIRDVPVIAMSVDGAGHHAGRELRGGPDQAV